MANAAEPFIMEPFTTEPFIIKICGITNEGDARLALEAGANALGFNFYPGSPRYLTPQRARQIVAALPLPFLKVGVFVNAAEAELIQTAQTVPLDVLQLHGDACALPSAGSYRIWRSISAETQPATDPRIEAYLIDTPTSAFGGSGRSFNWSLAAHRPYRVILAGGLDASNAADAIKQAAPWGIDACSRLEASPGNKNAQQVRAFVRAALAESQLSYEFVPRP